MCAGWRRAANKVAEKDSFGTPTDVGWRMPLMGDLGDAKEESLRPRAGSAASADTSLAVAPCDLLGNSYMLSSMRKSTRLSSATAYGCYARFASKRPLLRQASETLLGDDEGGIRMSNYGSMLSTSHQEVDFPVDADTQSEAQDAETPNAYNACVSWRNPRALICRWLRRDTVSLLLVSVSCAVCLLGIDMVWSSIQDTWLRLQLSGANGAVAISCAYRICLVVASVCVVEFIAPAAEGSGIPQLKAVLAGQVDLTAFLSSRCFAAKAAATALVLGAGVTVGREGPFIHIAAALAALLQRNVFRSSISKRRVLCAAAAIGISAAMGSAIGGTLFSIEVTSITFIVSYYWSTFSAGILVMATVHALQEGMRALGYVPLFTVDYRDVDIVISNVDVVILAVLGTLCGLLSAAFVRCFEWWVRYKQTAMSASGSTRSPMAMVLLSPVAQAVAVSGVYMLVCAGAGGPMLYPVRLILDDLLVAGEMPGYWAEGFGENGNLVLFAVTYFVFTILFMTLRLPSGVFSPTFCAGAALGRLVAKMSIAALPSLSSSEARLASYALLCGAGFTAGVTQTFSAGLIAYGLTGYRGLEVPILLVTMLSCGVSVRCTHSIYTAACVLRRIPVLLVPSSSKALRVTAGHIMTPINDRWLLTRSSVSRIRRVLLAGSRTEFPFFPIIHSATNRVLLAAVSRDLIEVLVRAHIRSQTGELVSFESEQLIDLLDHSPLVLSTEANLQKMCFLFHTLRAEYAFVVRYGRVVGVVTKQALLEHQLSYKRQF